MPENALAMLLALARSFGGDADGFATVGVRGTHNYVHVVPRQLAAENFSNRHVAVLMDNGTVAFTEHVRDGLARHGISSTCRPELSIDQDVHGHSAGPGYGRFRWAIDFETAVESAGSLENFARLVASLL